MLLTGKFTRGHTFSSLLVLGAPMQPELLHQKHSSILSGKKVRHIKHNFRDAKYQTCSKHVTEILHPWYKLCIIQSQWYG
jgi:hypothetical protein